jgi:hypothetical protein
LIQNSQLSDEIKYRVADKTKYVCRDCDFIFFIGVQKIKKKPFCPCCGENIATEKCEIHRRHWTLKEIRMIDEIIEGNLTKYQVADLTKRSYGAVQRRYEKRMQELHLR